MKETKKSKKKKKEKKEKKKQENIVSKNKYKFNFLTNIITFRQKRKRIPSPPSKYKFR